MKLFPTLVLAFFINFSFAQSPNFVFILADDMGWNGTSVLMLNSESGSMSDFYETPNLVQLANDGMVFSQAYAPAAKCAPTRASILTGQTPAANHYTEIGGAGSEDILISAETVNAIPTADTTIGEWLNFLSSNYRTAHYGKWHINSGGTSNNGFDFGDGNTSNNDGEAGDGMTIQTDPKKIMDITNRAILFMQNAVAANEPFYLQLSHYAVHGPIETTQTSFDYFNAKPPGSTHDDPEFAGMTKDLDDGIGLILDEINNLGISGNTYVIFTSDHGSSSGMSNNAPLARGKNFLTEGGLRVPFIVKGPNITAGSTSAEPIIGYDLFPTIAELADNTVALPSVLEGQSLVPVFEQQSFTRNNPFYFHSPHYANNNAKTPVSAIISGNYKVVIEYETGIEYLYDLSVDLGENNNIAATNPVIYEDLRLQMRDYLKSVNANMPSLDPTHPNFSGTAPDIDNDGLEDEWEFRELLAYTYGPNDDPDGDGIINLDEYNGGTDPLVADIALAADEINQFRGELLLTNKVRLSWYNEIPTTLNFYEIEHSIDGTKWDKIGETESNASSFVHNNPIAGNNYYRLKLNYLDETIDYSRIIVVENKSKQVVKIFPNPSRGVLNIQLESAFFNLNSLNIQIFNTLGQLVKTVENSDQSFIPIHDLNEGIYSIRISNGQELLLVDQLLLLK